MSSHTTVDQVARDAALHQEIVELRAHSARLAAQCAALREREAQLTALLDDCPCVIYSFRLQPAFAITYLNAGVERLIGYRRDQLLASSDLITQIIHPDDRASFARSIALQGTPPLRRTLRCINAQGAPMLIETLTAPLRDAQGRITGYQGVATRGGCQQPAEVQNLLLTTWPEQRVSDRPLDLEMSNRMPRGEISDQERVESALIDANQRLASLNVDLRDSRDLLRVVFDSLDDGLVLINRDGVVLAANYALEQFYNLEVIPLIGTPWQHYCNQTAPLIARTLSSGTVQRGRFQLSAPARRQILVDARAIPLADDDQPTRVLLHLSDVTERVQLESLAMQNEQLAASSRLAAIVAHEVNTPLQAIQNFLFLASTSSGADLTAFLNLIGEEIDRVGALTRRLLDFHRPDDGTLKPISLNGLIERVLLLTGSTLAKKRIAVRRALADDLGPFLGRSDHITQVLLNLIWNAIDSMPNGGSLRLHTFRRTRRNTPARIVCEIQDTGPGIPLDLQTRIFEPFFTTKHQGTGLGLAVSKQIITQHGGMIDVRSKVDVGTTFVVTLPEVAAAP